MSILKRTYDYSLIIIALIVIMMWQLPYFGWIQYPFRLLGTWFHEMGHGLAALLVGGTFEHLEIYDNGGGVAFTTVNTSYLPYNLARAFTGAGGLLGPAIGGAILIIAAKREKTAMIALRVLIAIMIFSLLFWIRSLWGIITIGSFSVLLIFISVLKYRKLEIIALLFLGVQCIISTYRQLDYLFTKEFERNGRILNSDTQNIAENTFGTYWIWAIVIVAISIYLVWKSIKYYYKK